MPFTCSAKTLASTVAMFVALCLLAACAKEESVQPPVETMEITVDFRDVHRCSRISPEITVAYAPRGTKFYAVKLTENGQDARFLGGGNWTEDGTGIIPEGGLTQHYSGPCPPRGKEGKYTYVVAAMGDPNAPPLAVAPYTITLE